MVLDPIFLAVVIAAGRSSRFKGPTNKLLAPLCGRPLLYYPLRALTQAGLPVNVVVGAQADFIKQSIKDFGLPSKISFSHQLQPTGTASAVASSAAMWDFAEHIVVMNGDMPLVSSDVVKSLMQQHLTQHATVSFVTSSVLNPTGYGRVIVDVHGTRIVEEKDCTQEERLVCRINAGLYIFKRDFLEEALPLLTNQNLAGEFYLTDLIGRASQRGHVVTTLSVPFEFVQGVNTIEEFWVVEQLLRGNLVRQWVEKGVIFDNPSNLHLDIDVKIGANTRIGTGVLLLRGTTVGADSVVSPFSILAHATVGNRTSIKSHTVIQDSTVGDECLVGPFVRIKNNSHIKDNVAIESFVELTGCTLGRGVVVHRMCCLEDCVVEPNSVILNHVGTAGAVEAPVDFFGDEIPSQQQL